MSRPKRMCKEQALTLILQQGDQSDEEDFDVEVFDDATDETFQPNLPGEDEISGASDADDNILDSEFLHEIGGSESDSEEEEEEETILSREDAGRPTFVAPSGRVWYDYMPTNVGREPSRNIIRFSKGPAPGLNPENEREAILIFLDKTLDEVVLYTNLQGRRIINEWNRRNPSRRKVFVPTDKIEIEAFVGILILLGESKYYFNFTVHTRKMQNVHCAR